MTTEKLVEAIHREIDGENTPEKSRELMAEIARNPEASRRYAYLRFLSSCLTNAPSLEPPRSLKPAVMRSIEAREARKPARSRGMLFDHVFRPGARFAYGFAVGVACVALIAVALRVVTFPPVSDAEVSGTMGTIVPPVVFTKVQTSAVDFPQVTGSIGSEQAGRLRMVTLSLVPKTAVTATITFDPSSLALEGIQSADPESIRVGSATVSIRLSGGELRTLVFSLRRENPQPVELTLTTDEGLLYSQKLGLELTKNR